MANAARQVIVTIVSEESREPSADADSTENGPTPSGKKKKKQEESKANLFAMYLGKRVLTAIKDDSLYFAGKYFTATEDYKSQSLVSNASATIDTVMSAGFGIYAGVKVIGGFAGAVAGIAAVGLNLVRQTYKKYEGEAEKIVQNAYGNYFYGVRAGLVDGGHGTEN